MQYKYGFYWASESQVIAPWHSPETFLHEEPSLQSACEEATTLHDRC